MAENKLNPKKNLGKTLSSWKFPEFYQYKRGKLWYIVTLAIAAGVIVGSIFSNNYLFGLLILIVIIIFFFQNRRKPNIMEIRIKEDGIEVGDNQYLYQDMKNFWIIYRPPEIKTLYLDFKSTFRPTLPVSLENENPVKIREILKKYMAEDLDKEEEPASDTISRALKI